MNFKVKVITIAGKVWDMAIVIGAGICIIHIPPANAFHSSSHAQITISAFTHLKSYPHAFTTTDLWLEKGGVKPKNTLSVSLLEELMIRADVDTDYHYDLWLDAWFHDPFVGGLQGSQFTIFSSLMHYINVTKPGNYWKYDGYSYENSTKQGVDAYLNTTSVAIRGEFSEAFGGHHPDHPMHGMYPGPYKLGFTGTEEDWQKMYFGSNSAKDAVFPPANVPAEMAFETMMHSDRAQSTFSDVWNEKLPFVSGWRSTQWVSRHNWRAEIKDLPEGLDLLGISIHMAQDMGIPQHTQDTGENCHEELESLIEALSCPSDIKIDIWQYRLGTYGGDYPLCQKLYDPHVVEDFLTKISAFDRKSSLSTSDRLQALALLSNQWRWELTDNKMITELPDGSTYSAQTCIDLMKIKAVQTQAKIQYNLAVAATVALFEIAARQYEILHPPQKRALASDRFLSPP